MKQASVSSTGGASATASRRKSRRDWQKLQRKPFHDLKISSTRISPVVERCPPFIHSHIRCRPFAGKTDVTLQRSVSDGGDRSSSERTGGKSMSATIINIIIQLIAGAVGGNAAGAGLKDYNLGTPGNTIAGALGGLGGGQILTALLPMLAGTAENVDIGSVLGQAVGGGVLGAIVTVVVGLIKNTMVGQPAKR
jgi:hypothetical protein